MKNLIFALFVVVLLVGCGGGKVTVETEEGDQKIEVTTRSDPSWCQTGSEWKMSGPQAVGKMVIEGVIEGGKYDGYCHVTYDIKAEGTEANVDFYFNEEGAGYQVMDVNGQKFESQWNG
jgi:hypothetical protein